MEEEIINIDELFQLTKWVDEQIVSKNLIQKYLELYSILQANTQANRQKSPFESQKNNLIKCLNEIDLLSITVEQVKFLDRIGILETLGPAAIDNIENILFKNSLDIATAANLINATHQKLSAGIAKINQIKQGLDGCIETNNSITEDVLIRIKFNHETSISNISDLKKWSAIWFDICRGLAMTHNEPPESIRVVGALKGSIIIELAVIYGIVKTISEAILKVLKVTDKILEIRKKIEEIRALNLSNQKAELELENEIKPI